MTPHEFRVALARLDKSRAEFAEEIGYRPDMVRRWAGGSKPVPLLVERYVNVLLERDVRTKEDRAADRPRKGDPHVRTRPWSKRGEPQFGSR